MTAAFVLLARPAQGAVIEIWQAVGPIPNLATADALIASGPATFVSFYSGPIDFDDLGDGTRGLSSLDLPWPGAVTDTFAARLTGGIVLAAPQVWWAAINHDDGVRLRVNGAPLITFAGETDNITEFAFFVLNAGLNIVEITFFENFGGASLELYGGELGSCCITERASLLSLQTVPEPATMLLVATGLGAVVARRRQKRA